jgi:hypothetical protein
MLKLSRMFDANVMKIYYENSANYQLLKRSIDVKLYTIKKYNFVEI